MGRGGFGSRGTLLGVGAGGQRARRGARMGASGGLVNGREQRDQDRASRAEQRRAHAK